MARFQGKSTPDGIPVHIQKAQYTEGDVDATLDGLVFMAEGAGDTVCPVKVDAAGKLQVVFDGAVAPGTEYYDGDINVDSKGTLIMGDDGTLLQNIAVDADGHLLVGLLAGGYDGVQYQDGAAVASPFGFVMLGHDGSNVFPVVVDSNGYLQVMDKKASVFNTVADVSLVATSTTQILGALGSRICALISNLATNTGTFRIGDASVGATRGAELAPGESISIESIEAIHGYNPGGGAESVSVIWTQD